MSNGFRLTDEATRSPTSPVLGYLPEANFFETPSAAARLPFAGLPRAPAVQDWDPENHNRSMPQGASRSKLTWSAAFSYGDRNRTIIRRINAATCRQQCSTRQRSRIIQLS